MIYFGNEEVCERILHLIKSKHVPKNILLIGPDGVGKRTLSLELFRLLNCTSGDDTCQCLFCESVKKEKSLGYFSYGLSITQDDMELLWYKLIQKDSYYRIVYINLDDMIDKKYNYFLKLMECDIDRISFVFCSSKSVPVAIKSRCTVFNLAGGTDIELLDFINCKFPGGINLEDNKLNWLVFLANGSFGDAIVLLSGYLDKVIKMFTAGLDLTLWKDYEGFSKEDRQVLYKFIWRGWLGVKLGALDNSIRTEDEMSWLSGMLHESVDNFGLGYFSGIRSKV